MWLLRNEIRIWRLGYSSNNIWSPCGTDWLQAFAINSTVTYAVTATYNGPNATTCILTDQFTIYPSSCCLDAPDGHFYEISSDETTFSDLGNFTDHDATLLIENVEIDLNDILPVSDAQLLLSPIN